MQTGFQVDQKGKFVEDTKSWFLWDFFFRADTSRRVDSLNEYDIFSDIPECSNTAIPACHEYADCTELAPGYTCECKDGFQGNGLFCEGNENALQKLLIVLYLYHVFLLL